MKQETKQKIPLNTFFGLSEQTVTKICQDMFDVQRCLDTNTIIIKNTSEDTKQRKAIRIENEMLGRREDDTTKIIRTFIIRRVRRF